MKDVKTKNYIEPEVFFEEMLNCLKAEDMSRELGEMFMIVSERFVNHPKWVRYTHIRDDLISTGIVACCRAYMKFRPNRNILDRDEDDVIIKTTPVLWDGEMVKYDYVQHYNPHAFFSTVIDNALLQFIKKEYNQINTINELKLSAGLDSDYGYDEMVKAREVKERLLDDGFDCAEIEPPLEVEGMIEWTNSK